MTQRERIASGRRKDKDQAEAPEAVPPIAADFLISTFWSIRQFCGSDYDGPGPMKPQDILGWSQIYAVPIRNEERLILLRMDATFRRASRLQYHVLEQHEPAVAEPMTSKKFKELFGRRGG